MKKPPLIIIVLLSLALTSCGGREGRTNGTSDVSITVGGDGRTASIKVRRNSILAKAVRFLNNLAAPSSAVAAIPSSVHTIRFTISAVDIDPPITTEVVVSGMDSVTETFIVENGTDRLFTVDALDINGKKLYSGSRTVELLDGTDVGLDIDIISIPQTGTILVGTANDDNGNGIAVDANGNVFITGGIGGSLDGKLSADAFLSSFNYALIRQWTQQTGSTNIDYAYAVATDTTGNVYVAGGTAGDMDGNTSAGGVDLFIKKFDQAGLPQWTRQIGSAGDDFGKGMAVDSSGNIYVAGYTSGSLYGTNAGGYDIFITKYDSAGNQSWVRQIGSSGNDYGMGIAVDSSGNAYVTGYTDDSLDGNANLGLRDMVVIKYDTSGNKQWTKQLGSSLNDEGAGISVDAGGNMYVTGGTEGSQWGTNAGYYDMFLLKLDSSGIAQWSQQYGTSGNDYGTSLVVDGSGNVYATGGVGGGVSGGYYDILTVKYNSSGVQQWEKQLWTTENDYGTGIAMDAGGNVYVTGYSNGDLDGNTKSGGYDVFLIKYDMNGVQQ